MILYQQQTRPAWRRPVPWLAAAALALAALLWAGLQTPTVPRAPAARPASALPRPVVGAPPQAQQEAPAAPQAVVRRNPRVDDPLASATDLKRLYDGWVAASDPALRAVAARAWAACVPVFLPPDNRPASPEGEISALPEAGRVPREAAWRSLWSRCQGFFGEGRERLLLQAPAMRSASRTPAEEVRQALLSGDTRQALASADRLLAAGDPHSLGELSGIARRWAEQQQGGDPPSAATLAAADVTDAALSVLECDFGADCSAQSLTAITLCANEGYCDGDLVQRRLARFGSGFDRAAVMRERERLAQGLRQAGLTSSAAWLGLP
jgi:hypothetical protein